MEKKQYNVTTTLREPKPRSKRLREIGSSGTSYTVGANVLAGGTAEGGGTASGHIHDNKTMLDSLSADGDRYLYVTQKDGEDVDVTTEKIKAGYADSSGVAAALESNDFASGVAGSGAKVDETGAAEFDSLTIRKFLEVPELRYNRVKIQVGDTWSAPGGGIVESVDENACTCTLHLEGGEIGAVAVGDICRGIYHSLTSSNNATADSDDSKGNVTFAGFATVYFRITAVSDDMTSFGYELRNGCSIHPMSGMTFVAYGNDTNIERQTSHYTTRTYERYLKGVDSWEIGVNNIAAQFGDLNNLSVHGLSMAGYSAYLNNIYLTGLIESITKTGGVPNISIDALSGRASFGAGKAVFNRDSAQVGMFRVENSDFVGYDSDGVERVRFSASALPSLDGLNSWQDVEFAVNSVDSDVTVESDYSQSGRHDINFDKAGSWNADGGSDTSFMASLGFMVQGSGVKLVRIELHYGIGSTMSEVGVHNITPTCGVVLRRYSSGNVVETLSYSGVSDICTVLSNGIQLTAGDWILTITPQLSISGSGYWQGSVFASIFNMQVNDAAKKTMIATDGLISFFSNTDYLINRRAAEFKVLKGSYGIMVSASGGALYTTDGGVTWTAFGNGGSSGGSGYTLPAATSAVLGGIMLGYSSTETSRAVLTSGNKAYVTLPRQIPTITLNGALSQSPALYSPTTAGSSGQVLRSSGSGAPVWETPDSVPVLGSTKMCTSGGVYSALQSAGAGGSEWYNLHTKLTHTSPPTLYTVVENLGTNNLSDTASYRMVLLKFRKHKGDGRSWRCPMMPYLWQQAHPTKTVVSAIPYAQTYWQIPNSGTNVVQWWAGQNKALGDVVTLSTAVYKNRLQWKNVRNVKMLVGCAIYKHNGTGTYGWQRVSNVAFVEFYLRPDGTYCINIKQ